MENTLKWKCHLKSIMICVKSMYKLTEEKNATGFFIHLNEKIHNQRTPLNSLTNNQGERLFSTLLRNFISMYLSIDSGNSLSSAQ